MTGSESTKTKSKVQFSLDLRIIVVALVLVIVGMLAVWKPWEDNPGADARTVEVVGEAVVSAEPDEFVFYPYYEFESADKDAALEQLSTKSDEITGKLKELGVEDSNIKTNTDGYDMYYYRPDNDGQTTYTLRIEAKVGNRELAQKVQDYLVTTTPAGQVSPQPQFSETKRKELESEARDQATKDARSKAEQSAKNLGFSIGKVQSVKDGAGFGDYPISVSTMDASLASPEGRGSLTVQPGENELRYSVSVSYFVK